MMDTRKTIKLGNLHVANPDYSPRAAQGCTIAAVVIMALLKLGII